jgi:uncharacterized small protein (DUF1192 family)
MTSLNDKIAALEVEIANLTAERNSIMPSDETKVERRDLLSTINAKERRLILLMQQQSQ